MSQLRPSTQKLEQKRINNNQQSEIVSNISKKQNYQWVAVYIDHKFYLTSAASYQKLQKLEQQIVEEKNKLNINSNKQKLQSENKISIDRQIVERQKKVRKNSIESELSRECKTQINELKALKARFQAEKQLAEEEMKYQNKTLQIRKRRQLKDATVFIIKDKVDRNEKSVDGQRAMKKKSDKSEKKFMMAPNQFMSGRKSQEKSRVSQINDERIQKFQGKRLQADFQKQANSKYKTIQPKKMAKQLQMSVHEGGNTVKMSQQSNQKKYFNSHASRSKEKSFVITSRRPPTSNSKQHRNQMINGLKQHKNKQQAVEASEQILKLNKKLKQMQQKLNLVEKKQKQLQQMQKQKQKFSPLKDESKTKQIDDQKSRVSSHLNDPIKSKHSQKPQKSIVFRSDTKPIKKQEKKYFQPVQTNQKSEHRYIQKQIPQQNAALSIELPNKRKKLGITSLIVTYNHNEFLQKQKVEEQDANIKEKMSQQINELKMVIRQLKIQKIKQEVLIQDLTKKQKDNENSKTIDIQRNQLTFNGQTSVARSIQSNYFSQKQNQVNKFESQKIQRQSSQITDQPLIKKQPRRYFKIETSIKKKFSIETASPVIQSKNSNTFTMNSAQIKNYISRASSYNPQQQNSRQNFMNLYQSRELKKKGTIVKQIINKEKFKESNVNSVDESREQIQQLRFNSNINIDRNSNTKPRQNNLVSYNSEGEVEEVENKQQYIRKLIQTQFTRKSDINIPQLQSIEEFPIPQLPKAPASDTPQSQVLERAKKVCQIFEIKLQGNDQLQFKRFKNCIILIAPGNGKAIVWHFSGKFYIGGWDQKNSSGEDHKTGEGFQYAPEKHYYRGQFLQGKRHGNGTMLNTNGSIYKGSWIKGQRQAKGIYYEKNTNSYYWGDWKDGKKHGHGILKISDKEFYDGQFDKGIKSGFGVQIFPNGDIYEGFYKNGKFNGQGKYFWANGSIYSGNFIEGQRQGLGKWISSLIDGDIYEGYYKNDKKSGKGKYTWAKGCIFQGQFKSDLKHGQGCVQYADGRKVKGIWQFGKLKQIEKSANVPKNQPQEPIDEISPRIRPNFPVIVQTPSKQMQYSRVIGKY